jgi:hypothetical protein
MSGRAVRSLIVMFALAGAIGATPTTALGAGDPTVVAGHKSGPVAFSGRSVAATLASLPVSAGIWSVFAKLDAVAVNMNPRRTSCRLVAGGDFDNASASLDASDAGRRRASLRLLVTHAFGAAGAISLRCSNNGEDGDVTGQYIRIVATRVNRIDRYDMSTSNPPTVIGSGTPRVVTGWLDGPVATTTFSGTTAALPLGAGNWAIAAKVVAAASATAPPDTAVGCALRAGGDFDSAYERDIPARALATEALDVVHHFTGTDVNPRAVVTCTGPNATVRDIKITALKVGTLTNQPLPGTGASPVGSGSPVVRAGYIDDGYPPGGGAYSNFAVLHVPTGSWAVTAKISPFADIASPVAPIWCELASGRAYDRSRVELKGYDGSPSHDHASMSFALTRTITAGTGGTFLIRCADEGGSGDAIDLEYIKIVAVKAGSLRDSAI